MGEKELPKVLADRFFFFRETRSRATSCFLCSPNGKSYRNYDVSYKTVMGPSVNHMYIYCQYLFFFFKHLKGTVQA